MSVITKLFSSGGSYFSSDLVVLLTIFIICFSYALYFGKHRAISLILAFYPAQYFFEHFPFINNLLVLKGDIPLLLNHVLIFFLFLIPLDIVIGKFVFQDSGYGTSHYFRIAGYAVAMLILVLLFSYSVVDLNTIHHFSPSIDALFNAPDRIFFWHIAPLIVLFVL